MSNWLWSDLRPSYDLYDEVPPDVLAAIREETDLQAWLFGRRSGKSTGLVAKVCMEGIPGEVHPYVAPTQQKARDICWPILERFHKTHGIGLDFNRSTGVCTTDRGIIIKCMGLSTKPEIEKLRGERYPGVIFDECGALNQDLLRPAVDEAAEPATLDFAGRGGFGVICAGTPSYAPVGYWHEVCGGNGGPGEPAPAHGFAAHRGNVFGNTHIRNARALLAKKLAQKGWTEETPEYIREWLGRFCISSDGLCYGNAWNGIIEPQYMMPLGGYTIMALDFGEVRPCAWVIIRIVPHTEQIGDYVHHTFHVHVLETFEKVCDSIHEITAITRAFQSTYHCGHIVGDSAEGFGIRHMNDVFGMGIIPARKGGSKQERIFLLASMLRARTLRIYEKCVSLCEQIPMIPWNEDRDDHHPQYNDHTCDATHYALELASQMHAIKPAEPVPGSDADLEARRLALRRKILNAPRGGRSRR